MKVAVLADIHANVRALEAVLEAVDAEETDFVVVLGDLVGYGARPGDVLDLVRLHVDLAVLGNHDHAVLAEASAAGTSASARRATEWTRARLRADQLAQLAQLPKIARARGLLCAHGCYLNPDHYYGYVTSTMLDANLDALEAWPDTRAPVVGLCGHTHVPMAAYRRRGELVEMERPSGTIEWPADADSVLLNPGAVGQPRDGDPRASFALVDPHARTAELRRVSYDVEGTVMEILAAGLPEPNAERLREGR